MKSRDKRIVAGILVVLLLASCGKKDKPAAPTYARQYTQTGAKLVGAGATGASRQGLGVAVSSDGSTVLVGGDKDASGAGAVWVFAKSSGAWSQQGTRLVGTGATGPAAQGYSCALSADGNTAVIGGPSDDASAGAVWVFTRTGGVWSQQGAKLVGAGAVGKASLGIRVAISADGNTIAAGGHADNAGVGAAWIFTRSGGAWTQQGNKLVGTGGVGASRQGAGIALSADGNTCLVGAEADNSDAGAAWVFVRSGGAWAQQGAKLAGTGASGNAGQGARVALSGDGSTAVVGGDKDASNVGATWVFVRSGSSWAQQGSKLTASDAVGTAQQGTGVAISDDGNLLVVGGLGDSGFAGATWVYARDGSTWRQIAKLVGTGASGAAYQGFAVAVSGDGNTIASGGYMDASSTGAAWLFGGSLVRINAAAAGGVLEVAAPMP